MSPEGVVTDLAQPHRSLNDAHRSPVTVHVSREVAGLRKQKILSRVALLNMPPNGFDHVLRKLECVGFLVLSIDNLRWMVAGEGYEPTTKEVWVERGSRQSYTIALRPVIPTTPAAVSVAPSTVAEEPIQAGHDDRKPLVKRPGFWAVIGAAVAVGVGVGVGVALSRRGDDSPPCGTTGTCATTQGLNIASF